VCLWKCGEKRGNFDPQKWSDSDSFDTVRLSLNVLIKHSRIFMYYLLYALSFGSRKKAGNGIIDL
jgi:hypothetical protein